MANATVEKLKALGLRHGEKAAVGLAAALFLLFLVKAVAAPSLDLTADQVDGNAKKATQNINQPQPEADILQKLETDGIKATSFEKTVDLTSGRSLDPAKFALAGTFVTPEPGAGLIRDTPDLIAPTDLYARAGRGGALVYRLEAGNRVVKEVKDEAKTKRARKHGRRRPTAMNSYGGRGSGGYGQQMGGGGSSKSKAERDEEAKKKREEQRRKLEGSLVGKEKIDAAKEKAEEESAEKNEDYEEETKGLRWVALVAVVDNKKLRENYATALKREYASVYPDYSRLDVERQVLQDDGEFSKWEAVDRKENEKVLLNIPEADEELTEDDVRLESLVDFLPFLRAGYWKGVHVASLVPKSKREMPKEEKTDMAGGFGASMGGSGYGASSGGSGYGKRGGLGGYGQGYQAGGGGSPGYGAMGGRGRGGYGGESSGGGDSFGGGAAENTDFPKSEKEQLMARTLDFTVEPDTTYRFRARIVVFNPNKGHEDVSPGVDTDAEELFGPWSDPSDEVTVPADVTAYAMRLTPGSDRTPQREQVHFQVARWNPNDGLTAIKVFDAGPGQVLGETRKMEVPLFDDTNAKDNQTTKFESIDFNTRQVVLDTAGGPGPLPRSAGINGPGLDVPVTALMLRPDGSVVLRDQAVDTHNDEMVEMKTIYDRALDEAKQDSKKPAGGGYGASGYGAGGYGAQGSGRKRGGR